MIQYEVNQYEVLVNFCIFFFQLQGEPGKPGEKGNVGLAGPRVCGYVFFINLQREKSRFSRAL